MKKYLLLTLLGGSVLHTFSSRAQIVSGNAYLQNSYLQTSVSGNGRLYTGTTPPAGYQSSYYDGLGFIVDLDKDGWTIGNPPYYGDWFRCGSPVEEWYLQVGNVVYHPDGSDSTILPSKVKGNVYYYKATTTNVTARWQATLGDILLEQDYTVPSDSLMIQTQVRIKNTGATTLKNVYYQRVTEMDFADPRYSTSVRISVTHNRIRQQPYSGKGLAWVQESADTGCRGQMNMVANDCRAKAFILDAGLIPFTSPDTIYQGIAAASHYYYTPGDYVYNDLGMGLVFKMDSLRPGETTSLSMIYRVDSAGLSSGLGSAYKSSWNIGGVSYKSKDTVSVCPGTALSVSIDFPGSSDWVWDAGPTLAFTTGTANTIAVGKDTLSYRAIRRASGCTGADTLLLTVAPFVVEKPVIVRTRDRLTTTKAYKFYQWMRNGIDIPGATAYYYDIIMKGCYSVTVTDDHNCQSTSDTICDGLSVAAIDLMGTPLVYPNPVEHTVRIEAAVPLNAQIADITGRVLLTKEQVTEIDMHLFNKGVYLLYLYTPDNKERKVYKLLKQ